MSTMYICEIKMCKRCPTMEEIDAMEAKLTADQLFAIENEIKYRKDFEQAEADYWNDYLEEHTFTSIRM